MIRQADGTCEIVGGGMDNKEDFAKILRGEVLERALQIGKLGFRFDLNDIAITGNRLAEFEIVGFGMLPQNADAYPSSRAENKINQGFEILPV